MSKDKGEYQNAKDNSYRSIGAGGSGSNCYRAGVFYDRYLLIMNPQILLRAVAVGILATLMMDLVASVGFRLGFAGRDSRRQGLEVIGWWRAYLLRGQVRPQDILLMSSLPGESSL